jgi:hypothetical protein
MNQQIDELIDRIKELEEELEIELNKKREQFAFVIDEKRVRFTKEVPLLPRQLKSGFFRYLAESKPLNDLIPSCIQGDI